MQKPFAKILVLACSLGLLAGCQTHRAAPVPMAMPATSIELRMPRPGLYTAGQPAADDWAAIAARGVGSVIDLRAPGELKDRDEAAEVRSAGMRYVAIPVAGADGITDGNARLLRDALAAARGPVLAIAPAATAPAACWPCPRRATAALRRSRRSRWAARPAWPAPRRGSGRCWNRRLKRARR